MYYKFLNRIVQMFNSGYMFLLWPPKLNLYAKYRSFKTIVNPMRWFLAKGNFVLEKRYIDTLLNYFDTTRLPFLAIMDDEGIWFADLSKKYQAILSHTDFLYAPVRTEIEDGTLMYNYSIFFDERFKLHEYIKINAINSIFFNIFSVEYVLTVKSLVLKGKAPDTYALAKIYPRDFVFNGVFLTHQKYDANERITTQFLGRLLKLAEKIATLKPLGTIEGNREFTYKTELLDAFETQALIPILEELGYTKYTPELGGENNETRLKRIAQVLKHLKDETK